MTLDTLRAALDAACALVTALEAIPTDTEDLDRADFHADAVADILRTILAQEEAAALIASRKHAQDLDRYPNQQPQP